MGTFLQPNNWKYSTVKIKKLLEAEEVLWVALLEVLGLFLRELSLWELP